MKYITILLTLTIFTFGINSVRGGELSEVLSEEPKGDGTESVYQKLRKNYEIERVISVSSPHYFSSPQYLPSSSYYMPSLYYLQQAMDQISMSWIGRCFFEDTPQGTDLITLRLDPSDQTFVSLATSQESTDNPNHDLSSPKMFYDIIKAKRYLIFQLDGVNKTDSVEDRLLKILGESEPTNEPQQTVPGLCHFWEKWDMFDE